MGRGEEVGRAAGAGVMRWCFGRRIDVGEKMVGAHLRSCEDGERHYEA